MLDYRQFLKFSIIELLMLNNDVDLEDLILKLLLNTQKEERTDGGQLCDAS